MYAVHVSWTCWRACMRYVFPGPDDGYVCGTCFLDLERSYRADEDRSMASRNRKEITPIKTPRVSKKVRDSATPKKTIRPTFTSTQKIIRHALFSSITPSSKSNLAQNHSTRRQPISSTISSVNKALQKSKYYTAIQHIMSRVLLHRLHLTSVWKIG